MAGITVKALHSSSSGNLFILYGQRAAPVLLDCGLPVTKLKRELWKQGLSVAQLAGCMVTHAHQDHARAAPALMAAGVDVYCSADTAQLLGLTGHRLHVIAPGQPFKIGSWQVIAFDAVHDCAGAVNFLVAAEGDKLVYITDTAYCPFRFNGLTHIIVECNYALDILAGRFEKGAINGETIRRIIATHMGIDTVKDFLKANDLKRVRGIWLAHLSDGNSSEKVFKRTIMELTGRPVYIVSK